MAKTGFHLAAQKGPKHAAHSKRLGRNQTLLSPIYLLFVFTVHPQLKTCWGALLSQAASPVIVVVSVAKTKTQLNVEDANLRVLGATSPKSLPRPKQVTLSHLTTY